jgi:hypothetical protein
MRDVVGSKDFAVFVEDVQEGVSVFRAALSQEPERAARPDEMLAPVPRVAGEPALGVLGLRDDTAEY